MNENGSKGVELEDDFRKAMIDDYGNGDKKTEMWHIIEIRNNRICKLKGLGGMHWRKQIPTQVLGA